MNDAAKQQMTAKLNDAAKRLMKAAGHNLCLSEKRYRYSEDNVLIELVYADNNPLLVTDIY